MLLDKTLGRAIHASGLTKEELAYKVLPHFFLDLIERYLRVRVQGARYIPQKGPYIVVANHSGYMGFDALMIAHQIKKLRRVAPRIIAHKLWFIKPEISVHAHRMGLEPATLDSGLKLLQAKRSLLLFPEGEEGNFKPTRYRYRLRKFRRGFVRLALQTGAPIVPSVVIGAEETHITLSQIRWAKEVLGIVVPIPLNVLPLPVKWTIQFLPPIRLKKDPERARDMAEVTALSREIRHQLQEAVHEQLRKRKTLFI